MEENPVKQKKIPPEQIQRDFEQKTNYLRSPSSLMNAR